MLVSMRSTIGGETTHLLKWVDEHPTAPSSPSHPPHSCRHAAIGQERADSGPMHPSNLGTPVKSSSSHFLSPAFLPGLAL